MLYDSKAIFQDQMEALEQASTLRGDNVVESPAWLYAVLEDRKDLVKEGKAKFVTIDELKNINK